MSQMNKEITSKILKMYQNFFLPTPSTPTIHSAPKQKIEISHEISSSFNPNPVNKSFSIQQPSFFEINSSIEEPNNNFIIQQPSFFQIINSTTKTREEEPIFTEEILASVEKELNNDDIKPMQIDSTEEKKKMEISLPKPEIKLPEKIKNNININYDTIYNSIKLINNPKYHNMKIFTREKFEIFCYLKTHSPRINIDNDPLYYRILSNLSKEKKDLMSPTFIGPFLIGSHRYHMEHNSPTIDILFTCRQLNQLLTHNNYILTNLINNTVIRLAESPSNEPVIAQDKAVTRISVDISFPNSVTRIALYIYDVSINDNNDCFKYILSKKEEKVEEGRTILGKLFRMWKRKWRLNFFYPEIFDEIVKKYYDGTVSGSLLKIFFLLYKNKVELLEGRIASSIMKEEDERIEFYDKKIKQWYTSEKKTKKIKNACRESANYIDKEEFENVFG